MEIKEAQQLVDNWIKTVGNGYFDELTNMAILTEEVRIIARVYGRQVAKPGDLNKALADELADVLWVVLCLANQTGVDMTEAFTTTLRKKQSRDAQRFRSRE